MALWLRTDRCEQPGHKSPKRGEGLLTEKRNGISVFDLPKPSMGLSEDTKRNCSLWDFCIHNSAGSGEIPSLGWLMHSCSYACRWSFWTLLPARNLQGYHCTPKKCLSKWSPPGHVVCLSPPTILLCYTHLISRISLLICINMSKTQTFTAQPCKVRDARPPQVAFHFSNYCLQLQGLHWQYCSKDDRLTKAGGGFSSLLSQLSSVRPAVVASSYLVSLGGSIFLMAVLGRWHGASRDLTPSCRRGGLMLQDKGSGPGGNGRYWMKFQQWRNLTWLSKAFQEGDSSVWIETVFSTAFAFGKGTAMDRVPLAVTISAFTHILSQERWMHFNQNHHRIWISVPRQTCMCAIHFYSCVKV